MGGSAAGRILRALASTRREELLFAARATVLAPLTEGALALVELDELLALVDRWVPVGTSETPLSGADAERAVARAFRLQPWLPGRCLARALVQLVLHRRDGVRATLVVGVKRPTSGDFAAHAWIEPGPQAGVVDFEPILRKESL